MTLFLRAAVISLLCSNAFILITEGRRVNYAALLLADLTVVVVAALSLFVLYQGGIQ